MAIRYDSQIMVRMEDGMAEAIAADAEANERTVAQTVRLAIRQYLGLKP